jgi:hypothetical protein
VVSISSIGGMVGIGRVAAYGAFGMHAGQAPCVERRAHFTASHKSEQQRSVDAMSDVVLLRQGCRKYADILAALARRSRKVWKRFCFR